MVEPLDYVTCPIDPFDEANDFMGDPVVSLMFKGNEQHSFTKSIESTTITITFKGIHEEEPPKKEIEEEVETLLNHPIFYG
ncbi:hypothetical protein QTN25_000236 [Entamoeba marina]